jgi:nucleotidyltransferase/DNA polymerase involved in DNA repair
VISCDEAVIDVSLMGSIEKIARIVEDVRREVEEKTKCTCSAGTH